MRSASSRSRPTSRARRPAGCRAHHERDGQPALVAGALGRRVSMTRLRGTDSENSSRTSTLKPPPPAPAGARLRLAAHERDRRLPGPVETMIETVDSLLGQLSRLRAFACDPVGLHKPTARSRLHLEALVRRICAAVADSRPTTSGTSASLGANNSQAPNASPARASTASAIHSQRRLRRSASSSRRSRPGTSRARRDARLVDRPWRQVRAPRAPG